MTLNPYDADNLRQLAKAWVAAGRRSRAADIDASACGTRRDYAVADTAREVLEHAEEAFNAALTALTRG